MPLLRRQPFIKEPVPADIDPDEEVFHCKPTGEIFREYEQFFERVIVCNSLVWSCSLTGKPNLTYEEAVASEKKAMKHVQSFPQGLRCPVLLLALLTHRSRMNDMNDDVYSYIKDRFFVGEEVELAVGADKKLCKVLKVVPTTSSNLSNGHTSHTSDSDDPERAKDVTAAFYKYTVELTDGSRGVEEASPDQLSRPRRLVNRDKLKLFLKVHSEPVNGIWKVKDEFVNQYGLAVVKYSHFFPSPLPVFAVSTARKYKRQPKEEHATPDRVPDDRAEESKGHYDYNRYSPATVTPNRLKLTPEEKAFLKDKQRQEKMAEKMERKEKIAEVRARLKEEKGKARRKLKEQKRLEAEVMKEWSKPRDDLECDDLRPLPCPRPVTTRMQNELFGDVIEVLEFFECFGDVVGLRDRFPQGVTLDTMEKALLETDMNGPLTDLLAVFLKAIFSCQDQEDEDVLMEAAVSTDGQIPGVDGAPMDDAEDIDNASGALSHKELMGSAVAAAQVPQLCHGRSLKEFPLDALTVTEVLRLHFAASGARCNAASAKFRYQQRGGFMSLDDGGMELRRHDSDALLKTLAASNVFDLSPEAKLKIIAALVTQLLSYSSYRDIIEDELDSLKQARTELRQLQWAEQRREKEKASARYRKRLELKAKEGKVERRRGRKVNSSMNATDGGDGLPTPGDEPMDISNGQQQSTPAAATPKDDAASKKEARRLANKLLKDSAKREAAAVAALSSDGRTRRKAAFEDSLDVTEFFDVDWDVVIACASNDEEKATLLVRREEVEAKRKEAFLEKEREMLERAQRLGYKCGTHPLGRDRCYRRFWLFHSVPGLYVEQCDDTVPPEFAAAYHRLRADSRLSAAAGKENNEPGDVGVAKRGDAVSKASPAGGCLSAGGDLKSALPGEELRSEDGQAMIAFMTPDLLPVQELRWMCFGSEEDLDKVIEALNERGFREGGLKQALLDARPLLQQSLQKAHGDEPAVPSAAAVSDRSDGVSKGPAQSASSRSRKGRQPASAQAPPAALAAKGRGSLAGSAVQSAQEALELSLREALLDLEERIYAGVLGAMKVSDRLVWRQSVEHGAVPNGNHTGDGVTGAGAADGAPAADGAGEAASGAAGDLQSSVRGLAQALLDIQKGIDAKYLCQPLGDATHDGKPQGSRVQAKQQKQALAAAAAAAPSAAGVGPAGAAAADDSLLTGGTPDGDAQKLGSILPTVAPAKAPMTTLERWQDSLLASTSISQVFLHMSTLEKAIQWSKSALNARCALCRRKGDGEKMLLCDGCDRGHHMFCLKPPVKEVPDGDWFCPECRPKQARPSRQRAKRTFGQDEESFVERASAAPSSSSNSSAEDEDDEEDEEEEEEKDEAETSRQREEDEASPEVAALGRRDSPAERAAAPAAGKERAKARSKQRSRAKATDARSSSPCPGGSHAPPPKTGSSAAAPGDDSSSKAKKPRVGTPAATGSSAAQASAAGTTPPAAERRSGARAGDSGRRQRRRDAARPLSDSPAAADGGEAEQQQQGTPPKSQQRKSDGGLVAAEAKGGGSGRRSARSVDTPPVSHSAVTKTRHRGSDGHTSHEQPASEAGDVMQRCEELLLQLMKHDDAWPFLRPVSKREVPDYHTIIKHPMDFSTIKSKINLISYTDVQDVINDIRLVFENCQTYNLETSEVYKSGEKLSKLFESKLRSLHIEEAAPSGKRPRCS